MDAVKQAVGAGGPRLAWIGLGNMGRGMVKNIVEKGTFTGPLAIYNRTTSRTETLVSSLPSGKAKVCTSIPEMVEEADIIFTCVADDAAAKETIATALSNPSAAKGKLFVDCSTIHPDTTTALNSTITAAGALFVACPVFGAPAMADNGQLVCVLAGPRANISRVTPFCKGVMGRAEIVYADAPPALALRMKIVGNTFVLSMVETLAEGHVLAETSGLGSENLHTFIEAMFPGPYAAYSGRMKAGDYYKRDEPLFNARLARKDARHARSLAEEGGTSMKVLEVADRHLEQVVEHLGEKGDIASIYGAVRQEAGLKFELD